MSRGSVDGPASKAQYRRLKAKPWVELELGERVCLVRLEKALTMTRLAADAGLSYQVVSRVERGTYERHLNIKTVRALAEALGLTCGDLLDDRERSNGKAKAEAEVRAAAPG